MQIIDLTDAKDKKIKIVFKLTDGGWEVSNMHFDGASESLVLTRICSDYNYKGNCYDLVLKEVPGFNKALYLCHWNSGKLKYN